MCFSKTEKIDGSPKLSITEMKRRKKKEIQILVGKNGGGCVIVKFNALFRYFVSSCSSLMRQTNSSTSYMYIKK